MQWYNAWQGKGKPSPLSLLYSVRLITYKKNSPRRRVILNYKYLSEHDIAVLMLMRYKFIGFGEWGGREWGSKLSVPHLFEKCYISPDNK